MIKILYFKNYFYIATYHLYEEIIIFFSEKALCEANLKSWFKFELDCVINEEYYS